MKADQVLQRLENETQGKHSGNVQLCKEDARLILDRVNHLENVAAALLRSKVNEREPINVVLPYRTTPA